LYKFRRTRIALWDAPITATVTWEFEGSIFARSGGFSARSRQIPWIFVTGRGPVVGEEPVQSTRRSEDTVVGSEELVSGESIVTLQ
jgi:hypothetical protein